MSALKETELARKVKSLVDTYVSEVSDSSICQQPTVSVAISTFNHKQYIQQSIESVLVQETSFPYEIVISDDCSTDGTTDILRKYQSRYPDKIRLVIAKRNLWQALPNMATSPTCNIAILGACRGKYIALCEGDDYWTNPLKLQKQVDFLEKNTKFSICFHKIKILKNGEFRDAGSAFAPPATVTNIVDLACHSNYIHTASCVFRNNIHQEFFGPSHHLAPAGDYYLHMMNAKYGDIFYIDEVMSVYRVHENSVWSSKTSVYQQQKTLETYICILSDLDDNFSEAIQMLEKNIYYYIEKIYRYPIVNENWHISEIHASYINSVVKILFEQTQSQLQQTQSQLQQTQSQLQQTQSQLHCKQVEYQDARSMILAMESSKFWKLRKVWFYIKTTIKRKMGE